ncbi:hypothetical protein LZD49_26730 [Dyadobacter sp. CY261]|uniref:hypothetical protein n=1 Tax=Dyadobacter sp. CY261 TaxID=2907203 RepID=UPI001F365101|nr:hypothetical protein [Dyadobacter sp. CY261]MCF0074107.1 hypothetical protein [Dyadobacter sp. CY261]
MKNLPLHIPAIALLISFKAANAQERFVNVGGHQFHVYTKGDEMLYERLYKPVRIDFTSFLPVE